MRTWARRLAFGTMLLASFSCGGGSDKPITPVTPPTPTLSLFANAAAITVSAGTSTVMTVTVVRGGGFAGDVTLSAEGVPSAVTLTISPVVISAASSSSQVTIAVGPGATGATSSITIRASGSGVTSSAVAVALTVPPPVVPAIALTAGATTLNLNAGTSGTLSLTVTRTNFRGVVSLSIAGLPTGVTASIAPATLSDSSTLATLTLTAGAGAAAVAATAVTVTASAAGVAAQTVTFALTVTAAAVPGFSLTASPASLSIAAGQSLTSTVTIARTGGFAGNVTLSLDGAPPGVTTTFSPNPASGTSTVTVSVSGSAVAGTYTLSVRGAATGQPDRTTGLSVTVVPPPGITLNVNSVLTAAVGSVATLPISIARIGNYAGDVSLAVENVPSGVAAVFAPATLGSAATTSELQFTVPANATLGATTITVRASGAGVATQTVPVALTIVAAQGYSINATSVTATQGTTGTSTVTLTRIGGFVGTVNLAIIGLPTGVTGTFSPAAVTATTSSLALAVASTVPAGTYSAGIVITGTATGLANVTAPLTLTVVPRPVLSVVGGGAGTGAGRVTSAPAGIDCTITNGVAAGTCSASFNVNDTVQLQVAAGTLVNWTSGCTGAGACALTMTQDRSVGAVFALPTAPPVIVMETTKPVIVTDFNQQTLVLSYQIQNGGGGVLQPTLSTPMPAAPWLTQLRVAPDGGSLFIGISTVGLRPFSEATTPYKTSATLSANGASPVQIDIKFARTFDTPAGMAATVVRFHRNSGVTASTGPLAPNLNATIDLLDARTQTRIAASIITPHEPATQNWLDATTNTEGQLKLQLKLIDTTVSNVLQPAGFLPTAADPLGAPIRIRVRKANDAAVCPAVSIIPDPSCQVFVYYTSDPWPKLLLRPWGVSLTPANPRAIAAIEIQPGDANTSIDDPELLRHDCGNRLMEQPVVERTRVTVTGNFSALADDEVVQCTVKIRALYRDKGVQVQTDSASLLVTLGKPSGDAITPSVRDLNVVVAAGSTTSITKQITLRNLGPRVISLDAPLLINGTCPAGLIGTPTLTTAEVSLGPSTTRTVSLAIASANITATICTATLRLRSTTPGVALEDIPITVRRN